MKISEEIKNLEVSPKKIREFAFLVGGVFILLGGLAFWRGRPAGPWFLGSGAFLVFFGSVFPPFLKPLYRVWMIFAIILGGCMSRVMLTILFYGVITPIGLWLRLRGKDLLNRQFRDGKESEWILRHDGVDRRDDCTRQF